MVFIRPFRRGRNMHSGSFLQLAARNVAGFITLSAVVTVLAASLIGCETAAKKPSTDTEPADMAEPEPTLLGTWERTTVGTTDDGTVETEKQTVVITDTRFTERNIVLDADGVEIDSSYGVGTVSIGASTVTFDRDSTTTEKQTLSRRSTSLSMARCSSTIGGATTRK